MQPPEAREWGSFMATVTKIFPAPSVTVTVPGSQGSCGEGFSEATMGRKFRKHEESKPQRSLWYPSILGLGMNTWFSLDFTYKTPKSL